MADTTREGEIAAALLALNYHGIENEDISHHAQELSEADLRSVVSVDGMCFIPRDM